ncbi:breast cancer metastasis-suppressor 1-like protein isoform X4 [Branchiostoma floridae]|uniref:Breast cancer metastasis-suppressor 1-like protein isoform X4 n=1 Tax=Branchiostoma floridae TaxID=7739 RepID=A0A9J7LEJ5_BRAFL|nr:breast cancer metastasis-suppressor 1-like protein isoform X4 [Branchiostoma floridae]
MPVVDGNVDSEGEDMDQSTPDSDKSNSEESATSSASEEDDESSELDEEDCDRRRTECMADMADLERQFTDLKEQLYRERMSQIEAKLEEAKMGCAPEYVEPLTQLRVNMQTRTEVAGIVRELKIQNIRNQYEAELQATRQHFESEKLLLVDEMRNEIEEKIRRLEEDRHSADLSTDLWTESEQVKRSSRRKTDPLHPKKKKTVTISGPYLVYQLKENDILEDWTAIRKNTRQPTTNQQKMTVARRRLSAGGHSHRSGRENAAVGKGRQPGKRKMNH